MSVWDVSSKNECSGVPGQKLENATKIGLINPTLDASSPFFSVLNNKCWAVASIQ